MLIFPAIDLRGGNVVRLLRGDYDNMTVYGAHPADTASDFRACGAKCLHVVDLDGAKDDTTANFDAVRAIRAATDAFMEVGGGIRDEARVEKYLGIGVNRVILGTAAVEKEGFAAEMARRFPGRVAVGVDARDGFVATRGWLETTKVPAFDFCKSLYDAGAECVIYTDISKDGAMSGPNLPAYRRLCGIAGLSVIASGGVSSLADVRALRETGVAGAIIGKALYGGAMTLQDALKEAGAC